MTGTQHDLNELRQAPMMKVPENENRETFTLNHPSKSPVPSVLLFVIISQIHKVMLEPVRPSLPQKCVGRRENLGIRLVK